MANFTPQEIEEILQEFFNVTGKRQYIGARYVPIFGRKGETSIDWDNTKPYEPLTIVLYQGNSYTSRTYVPTGVDITDDYFWACTGNYNAQIETYRQEVTDAIAGVNDIKTALPYTSFDHVNTVKKYVDDSVSAVEDVIPASSFDSTNTVKEYVDSAISTVATAEATLAGLIPDDNFDSTNTVKKYIDDSASAIEDIIPAASFDSTNTVKKYIDDGLEDLAELLPSSDFTSVNTVKKYMDDAIATKGKSRNAIYIGNSYTDGVGSTSGSDGFFALTKDMFDSAYKFTGSGYGFAQYSGHSNTFINALQEAASSSLFSNSSITHIIVTSAMGDTRAIAEGYEDNLSSSLSSFVSYAKEYFANAKVYIHFAELVYGRSTQSSYSVKYWMCQLRLHYLLSTNAKNFGYSYLGWTGWNVNNASGFNDSDNYHPNDRGYTAIVAAFLMAWHGESPYVVRKSSTFGPESDPTYNFGTVIQKCPDEAMIRIKTDTIGISKLNNGIGDGVDNTVGTIVGAYALPSAIAFIPMTLVMVRISSGTWYPAYIFTTLNASTGNAVIHLKFAQECPSNTPTGFLVACPTMYTWFHPNYSLNDFDYS